MALFYLGYMLTETLKTNMDTLFLPGLRFAILFSVIALSMPYKTGQEFMAHSSLSGWASNSLL
jgi:hypothetical protein